MRLLLLTVCFILTACASTSKTDNYFRTTGVGNTYEEAKHNAFKEAIEYQVGVVIASERESYNEKLIKDEILAYSSAYVDEYKIISEQYIGTKIQVVVDVKLSLLRLSDRILSKGKDSKTLDGAKHNNQYRSFLESKENGDKIIATVLNDYHKRAFIIKQGNYLVKVDAYRDLTLTIPYEMYWDKNYVASFHDAIKVVSDGKPSLWSKEKGFAQQYPSTVVIGYDKYYFNDFIIPNKILGSMMNWNEIRINMEIKDLNNRTQYSECFMPKAVDRINSPFYDYNYIKTVDLVINQHSTEQNKIEMKIHKNSKLAYLMQNLSAIELSVVPKKLCARNN
jgi:predicted RNase H-like HicB family nuclease